MEQLMELVRTNQDIAKLIPEDPVSHQIRFHSQAKQIEFVIVLDANA
jgi:hypothetical protein